MRIFMNEICLEYWTSSEIIKLTYSRQIDCESVLCFAIAEADIVIGDERAQHKKIPLKYVSEQKSLPSRKSEVSILQKRRGVIF